MSAQIGGYEIWIAAAALRNVMHVDDFTAKLAIRISTASFISPNETNVFGPSPILKIFNISNELGTIKVLTLR
jgi:hypothetical protein